MHSRSLAERLNEILTKPSSASHRLVFNLLVVRVGGDQHRLIPGVEAFDPFPFGILTLIVSTEGVLLALIILISQNRMTRQADRRAHLDLQISLLAEQETTVMLHTVERIARHLGLPEDAAEVEASNLVRRTDLNAMMRRLEERLPKD